MGYTAELVSEKFKISKEEMDQFSVDSNDKALAAQLAGKFNQEIMPVQVKPRKGEPFIVDRDEGPRKTSLEKLATLRPAFKSGGLVTAGNSSRISDGASCLLLMTREKAKALGCRPMVRLVAQGAAGLPLEDVLVTPIKSIPKVLAKAGVSLDEVDLHELNEAFAATSVAIVKELGIDMQRVNVNGGAVALGHPIGCSGARVLTTLIYAMKERDVRYGMASLCLGGGEAVSLLVENI